MNYKMISCAFLFALLYIGCTKENNSTYTAEGNVYLSDSHTPVSNVPIYMSECNFTGTRCTYTSVSVSYTDASGHYKIAGHTNNRGAIYIEVGINDKTFGSDQVNVVATKRLYQDFYVDKVVHFNARFVVQPQNRNFVSMSIISGLYKATGAVVRNTLNVIDTTLQIRTHLNSEIRLEVLLRNATQGIGPYSDSLFYSKTIGIVTKDTSVLWYVP